DRQGRDSELYPITNCGGLIEVKLRLRGNTLRLRLTVGEVAALGAGDEVTEATLFPDGSTLRYRLR
ncbi:MAG TPA: hypothetical protein DER02_03775, partial [Gammaproteobacteria bacterium]|nr:hypothetical protein [Gammaproteobacteria bacterium]